ncbi:AAA family ATPase [Sphingomonas oryzagri]
MATASKSISLVGDEDMIPRIAQRARTVLSNIRTHGLDERTGKKAAPTFPISRAAQLIGRSPSAIREAEKDGRLPTPDRTDSGRRVNYSLEDIDRMRALFDTRPCRDPEVDDPVVISVSNFKGGVGKSTVAVHLAQYLAIRGYRVCLIDCDSQASTTMMCGYVPDLDFSEHDTLYGYYDHTELGGLAPLIRKTHFHGLDLIPSNLQLYNLEYEIAADMMRSGTGGSQLDFIHEAIQTVAENYDVMIIDPPPALGMVSLSVLSAANALVIPCPPSIVDYSSTASFLDMLDTTRQKLRNLGRNNPIYKFVKLVGSKVDDNRSMHSAVLEICRNTFGTSMLAPVIKSSAEIDNASSRMMSVYELEKPITSHQVFNRCVASLDAVNYEIEQHIIETWPSKAGGR